MTYNQIIKLFSDIADAHEFIKSFGHGRQWEINANDNFNDYVLWATPVDSTTADQTKSRTFNLSVFRRIDKAKKYETDILSNCEQILDDIIKILRNESDGYEVVGEPVLLPFTEKHSDWCAGWDGEVTILSDFNNSMCDIPSEEFVSPTPNNNASYIIDEDGNIVFTLYPGQTFIQATMNTDTAEPHTLVGLTQTLNNTPVFIYGIFAPNIRLVEGTDYTVVGSTVTFTDTNYTGTNLIYVYSY